MGSGTSLHQKKSKERKQMATKYNMKEFLKENMKTKNNKGPYWSTEIGKIEVSLYII